MIKANRASVDEQSFRNRTRYGPMGQIPCTHVVSRIAQDDVLRKARRYEIGPPLVRKQSTWPVIKAKILKTVAPPRGKSVPFRAVFDADKAEVVNAILQRIQLVVHDRLPRLFCLGNVRCEQDRPSL